MQLWNSYLYSQDCGWIISAEEEWMEWERQWLTELGIIKDGVCQQRVLLDSVVIPNTVQTINNCAFCYNQNLRSVTLPSSIKRIEGQAFQGNRIESIKLDHLKKLEYIGVYAFAENNISGTVVIPDSVTSMDYYAFGTNNITNAVVSANLAELPMYTFYNNPNMEYVKFKNSQMNIRELVNNQDYTFGRDSSFIVKVPSGSASWYRQFSALNNYRIEEY